MDDFPRIRRLPPYIFSITDQLKREARARGEDIIDFGMGNPDQPTPQHIVDKLVETVQRGDTHRYSQSKGIPRLRKAISDWYKKRFDVDLDPLEFDTMGGLVTSAFGHVPRRGETIEFGEFVAEVLRADSRRPRLLRITRQTSSE